MEVLVESRNVVIKVQNTEGYQVCTACRGSQDHWKYSYYNRNAIFNGGLVSVSQRYACPKCNGKGFWKVAK